MTLSRRHFLRDSAQALSAAQRALASARSERSGDPVADRYRIAAAYRLLGDARERAGDREGASEIWSSGLAQLPASASERPQETSERAELLKRLGHGPEARALTEHLAQIGYRSLN